ncbi:precorrin-8X methylmutase [Tumidithrix elongata RA019]|uniref:Precorrin-8X methylmutase n=1 Tax=Tumidithrix elongata BACA0141 TaxID=2716417 RepID=A0AAW9PU26_9CYAN|nr:precorrin-8X methylmutase [Tumidithrix elongata RA019]
MSNSLIHPITAQSFATIDREIGAHAFNSSEYAIVQRVIHSTADFEFKHLVKFSQGAIAAGIKAIQQGKAIVTDVGMVKQGIVGMAAQTFKNPVISALDFAEPISTPEASAKNQLTRSEIGMRHCMTEFPDAIFVVGNAPTALLALCASSSKPNFAPNLPNSRDITSFEAKNFQPSLIVGAPVGFVAVLESKAALEKSGFPQIRVEGRKGGSSVAAAIANALLLLAWTEVQ